MSAPSWASLIAWLRPWLRAAPVMKATLPATRPGMMFLIPLFLVWLVWALATVLLPLATNRYHLLLLVREAGVDRERDAGDVARVVGDQPDDRVGDVDRLDHRDRQRVGHRVAQGRVLGQELLHGVVDHHRGVDPGGVHGVDPDRVRGQVVGVGAHQADHAVLGGGVAEA